MIVNPGDLPVLGETLLLHYIREAFPKGCNLFLSVLLFPLGTLMIFLPLIVYFSPYWWIDILSLAFFPSVT